MIRPFVDALCSATPSSRVGKWQQRRLAENLELDSDLLRLPAWQYPSPMPVDRGLNIISPQLVEAATRLAGITSYSSSLYQLLIDSQQTLSPVGSVPLYKMGAPVTVAVTSAWYVMSFADLRFSWGVSDSSASWKQELFRKFRLWMSDAAPATSAARPIRGELGLGKPGGFFWIGTHSPLESLRSHSIAAGSATAANSVIQSLALPGYGTRAACLKAMGMVAIEFPTRLLLAAGTPGQAWKPTALDTLGYKGHHFLPGITTEPHGRTWPLRACLKRPRVHCNGVPELIHPSIKAPAATGTTRHLHVLGWFDPAFEAQWAAFTASLPAVP